MRRRWLAALVLGSLASSSCEGPAQDEPDTQDEVEASAAGLDSGNARTGTWYAKATLASSRSWTKLNHAGTTVSTNKTYAASIWVKGTGKLRLDIVDNAWANNLASVTFTATSSWQQVSVPSFSSGSNTTVNFSLYDQVGGVAGTVYFDDAFLGLPSGTNLLSNPGFESGSTGWLPSGVFSIAQQQAGCTPRGTTDVTCDGVDDNCNGQVDEGFGSSATSCGVGGCRRTGATSCVSGSVRDSCVAGTPAPGTMVCTPGDTHAGAWSAKAALASGQTWTKLNHATTTVAQNTTYAASIWVKGAGKLRLDIVDNAWANNLASVNITGTSAWQQVSVPSFSSGSNTKVNFSLYDQVGGVAGTILFDDAFLGTPGGTNLLSNPGFESGSSGWTASGVFSVAQSSGSATSCTTVSSDSTCDRVDNNCDGRTDESCLPAPTKCPNGTTPGRSGCPDVLDALGREVSELQRLAADPATPAGNRPTGEQIKARMLATRNEVTRVVDSIPSDLSLGADDDLRPYVVSLGRALSANMLATMPPIGTLPDGTRSSDRLEGTSANPTVPLFSELISRLAYQDDGQEQTRALYRLADLQNLIHSLNRTELMQLDLGFSRVATALIKDLYFKKKKVVALAFYDSLLPSSLLIYDAAKRRYMPRVYQLLRVNPNQLEAVAPDGIAYVPRGTGLADRPQLPVRQFTGTLVDQMYCKQAPGLHFLDKFGIFLEDRTHGGRLNRLRLGNASTCQFLDRITDVTRSSRRPPPGTAAAR